MGIRREMGYPSKTKEVHVPNQERVQGNDQVQHEEDDEQDFEQDQQEEDDEEVQQEEDDEQDDTDVQQKQHDEQVQHEQEIDCQSEGFIHDQRTESKISKRKTMNRLAGRIVTALQVIEAEDPHPREVNINDDVQLPEENTNVNLGVNEATSKKRARGDRGKYKSFVVDMKIKGNGSKLTIEIPDEIDRAIGENALHLVNECGRIVRTKAPLNVKTWKKALSVAGDSMWKEIQDKFQVDDSNKNLKLKSFVIDTMQRLYRLWKCRLHYYYKSPKCGQTDEERLKNPPPDLQKEQWEWCVKRYGSDEFKIVSERNSKNRRSEKRCIHTTGNISFVEVEDMLTKENKGVKPSADVIWLIEHTHKNKEDKLEWADGTSSKIVHEKLKDVVTTFGDSLTQEEMLSRVFEQRSGYLCGKATTKHGKGKQQLEQQKLAEQQQKIHEQEQRIKEVQESLQKQQQAWE